MDWRGNCFSKQQNGSYFKLGRPSWAGFSPPLPDCVGVSHGMNILASFDKLNANDIWNENRCTSGFLPVLTWKSPIRPPIENIKYELNFKISRSVKGDKMLVLERNLYNLL